MTIIEIENKLVERLKERVPELYVEASPDVPSQYDLLGAKGCAIVRYTASRFDPAVYGSQRRQYEFAVMIGCRNFRQKDSHLGSYEYLQQIRAALTGFKARPESEDEPIEFNPVYEGFSSEQNGVWWHILIVTAFDTHKAKS